MEMTIAILCGKLELLPMENSGKKGINIAYNNNDNSGIILRDINIEKVKVQPCLHYACDYSNRVHNTFSEIPIRE